MKEEQKPQEDVLTKADYKNMMTGVKQLMTKMLGTEVKAAPFREKDYLEIKNVIEEARRLAEEKDKLDEKSLPTQFKVQQGIGILDKFLESLGMEPFQQFSSDILEGYNPARGYNKYMHNEDYVKQKRDALHKIIFTLDENQFLEKFEEFNNSIGDSMFDISQMSFKLEEKLGYILKERKRPSKVTVEKFLDIYKNIAAAFLESMITYLHGIQLVSKGKFEPYSVLRKHRISDQLKELRKDPLFRTFVEEYDNNIRNSIIHGGYHLDLVEKKIHFSYKNLDPLEYNEFVRYVQEVVKNAIFIINMKAEISFLMLQASREKLSSVMDDK